MFNRVERANRKGCARACFHFKARELKEFFTIV